jgi:multimeric flavodoxin WrbA
MKTALILNGSPRPKGNTVVLINWARKALQDANWRIEQADLYAINFRGCAHCDTCKKSATSPACVLTDDFSPVLEQIIAADLIIIASPVYCWSVSGCMSAALDRFYSLFKKEKSFVAGKKIIGLLTAGGEEHDGIDICDRMIKSLCEFSQADYLGAIHATNCESPEEVALRTELQKQVTTLVHLAVS